MLLALVGAMAYPDAKVANAPLIVLFSFICLWCYIYMMVSFFVDDKT